MDGLKALWGGDAPRHDTSVDAETVFDVLSNSRRRFVIKRLVDVEETDLDTLTEELAFIEADPDQRPADHRKNVYVGLYQSHLPRLDEDGFAELGERGRVVTATERTYVAADVLAETREILGGAE